VSLKTLGNLATNTIAHSLALLALNRKSQMIFAIAQSSHNDSNQLLRFVLLLSLSRTASFATLGSTLALRYQIMLVGQTRKLKDV
jgi:hypothetical protein